MGLLTDRDLRHNQTMRARVTRHKRYDFYEFFMSSIFVAVAEHEHDTRAAESLNLTQSATSAAIAALEARYKVNFF
jgi:Bacterial regulatory helix-turn-helix protein, lysR family